jgi:hypothetical protein
LSVLPWRREQETRRDRAAAEDHLTARIAEIHTRSGGTYGAARVTAALRHEAWWLTLRCRLLGRGTSAWIWLLARGIEGAGCAEAGSHPGRITEAALARLADPADAVLRAGPSMRVWPYQWLEPRLALRQDTLSDVMLDGVSKMRYSRVQAVGDRQLRHRGQSHRHLFV